MVGKYLLFLALTITIELHRVSTLNSQLSTLNNIPFHQPKYVESTQYKEIIDNNIENFKYSLNYQDHTHIFLYNLSSFPT